MANNYAFDDIGNRKYAGLGGNAWGTGLRYAHYAATNLNQYTQRTGPGYVEVSGSATNAATVTVNNQPTVRQGDYYWAEVAVGNSAGPQYMGLTNLAVLPDGSNADITTNAAGNLFVPKTSLLFVPPVQKPRGASLVIAERRNDDGVFEDSVANAFPVEDWSAAMISVLLMLLVKDNAINEPTELE